MAKKEKEEEIKLFRVTLPHAARASSSAGLKFKDGVAETSDAIAAQVCRGLGYKVEKMSDER